jgi:hypothetical protein
MSGHPTAAVPLNLPVRRAPRFPRRALFLIGAAVLLLCAAVILFASGALKLGAATREAGAGAPAVTAANAQAAAIARTQAMARANAARKSELRDAPGAGASSRSRRVADASLAAALFSPHTWHVEPPPPPPAPPPPPPEPTAPPFPYTVMGSYTPEGGKTVYFLSRADRVIDARVGDRLDGVYDFESADANQLVFNYLPLNIRQPITTGSKP